METIGTIILILFCIALYFLPTIIGWDKKNVNAICVLNLFLGWTFIGWIIALIWACCNDKEPPQVYIEKEKTTESNIYSELGKLAELHEKGAITDEEYLQLKQKLIGSSEKEI